MSDKITSSKKWELTLIAAALFAIVSAQFTYELTDKVSRLVGFETTAGGGPTLIGFLIHVLVFALLFRLVVGLLM